MEDMEKFVSSPLLTIAAIAFTMYEIRSLVKAIQALIIQRNASLEINSKEGLSLLRDIKTGVIKLYQLIRSR